VKNGLTSLMMLAMMREDVEKNNNSGCSHITGRKTLQLKYRLISQFINPNVCEIVFEAFLDFSSQG